MKVKFFRILFPILLFIISPWQAQKAFAQEEEVHAVMIGGTHLNGYNTDEVKKLQAGDTRVFRNAKEINQFLGIKGTRDLFSDFDFSQKVLVLVVANADDPCQYSHFKAIERRGDYINITIITQRISLSCKPEQTLRKGFRFSLFPVKQPVETVEVLFDSFPELVQDIPYVDQDE